MSSDAARSFIGVSYLLCCPVDELVDHVRHIKALAPLHGWILRERLEVVRHQHAHRLDQPRNLLHEVTVGIRAVIAFVRFQADVEDQRNGTVVGLSVHTVGGVIAPGVTVLEIVLLDDQPIVERPKSNRATSTIWR